MADPLPETSRPRIQTRIYELLEVAHPEDRPGRWIDRAIVTLICLNVISLVLESVDDIRQTAPSVFRFVDIVSVAVFTLEYLVRVWACTVDPRYSGSFMGRLRFMRSWVMLADLFAILPFYVLLATGPQALDLRSLRALRVVARALRLTRYSVGLQTMGAAIEARRFELITVLGVLGSLLVLASSLMYFAEGEAQPEKFSSIPAAMWWGIVTLTTVGYGDVSPITAGGRVIAGFISVLGIGFFALPAGILASSFLEQATLRRDRHSLTCPHCGAEIEV